ncbi:hypothetical protein [uncultured Desulfobacter sp.]|uniref:hypothetical protein n=1 Tax=uncultured Desulfobacter sp. TaxID=240139 RepID=UPI002AA7566B|nr:hypothetical protein [uncultured Desulfobacter sp.]
MKDGAGNDADLTHDAVADNASYKVDTVPTAFTGTYAVVTSAGIFADIDGDGTKDREETNELTGEELSTWLVGGDLSFAKINPW